MEETDLKKQIIENPSEGKYYLNVGKKYHIAVEYTKAERAFSVGIQLNSENSDLYCGRGLTRHNQGNHLGAIEDYANAIQKDARNAEAIYYMGFIQIQEGNVNDAIRYLSRCIEINPDISPAYYYLGIALERRGESKKAIELLTKRIEDKYPTLEPDSIFTLGEIISQRRKYETEECHATAIVKRLLITLEKEEFKCFGDSHRSVFNNIEGIVCYNVGSGTAYNLGNNQSTSGAGKRIHAMTNNIDPKRCGLIMAFGEIDCMEHIYKNSYRKKRGTEEIIEELAYRYLKFMKELCDKGFTLLIYGPAFSGYAKNSYGTLRQRNEAVLKLNELIKKLVKNEKAILFAEITSITIDKDYKPNIGLSDDGRHLDKFPEGSKQIQAVIMNKFLEEARKKNNEINTYNGEKKQLFEIRESIDKNNKIEYKISKLNKDCRDSIDLDRTWKHIIIDNMNHELVKGIRIGVENECIIELEIRGLSENKMWDLSGRMEHRIIGKAVINFTPEIIRVLAIKARIKKMAIERVEKIRFDIETEIEV